MGIRRRFLVLAVGTLAAILLLTAGEIYLAGIAFNNRALNVRQVEADRVTHDLLRAILQTLQMRDPVPPGRAGGSRAR